jgi:hypothetical protein
MSSASDLCVGLSADEWADITATIEATFDTPVTISRETPGAGTNGYGHKAAGSTAQVAAVNALFGRPNAPTLSVIADRIGALMVWEVSLPLGTDVATGDTITISATGAKYTVHVLGEPESYAPMLTVIVGKVA